MSNRFVLYRIPLWYTVLGALLTTATFLTSNSLECGLFRHLGYSVAGGLAALVVMQIAFWFMGKDLDDVKGENHDE